MWRLTVLVFAALWCALTAFGEEVINRFDVAIEVERDGDIVVTETINLTAENFRINRGIFRDLPRYYTQTEGGDRLRYEYDVLSVRRDGRRDGFRDRLRRPLRLRDLGDGMRGRRRLRGSRL